MALGGRGPRTRSSGSSPRCGCPTRSGPGPSRTRSRSWAPASSSTARRILTNAHIVLYAGEVFVQAQGERPGRRQGRRDRAGHRPGHAPPRGRDLLREAAADPPRRRGGRRATPRWSSWAFPSAAAGLASHPRGRLADRLRPVQRPDRGPAHPGRRRRRPRQQRRPGAGRRQDDRPDVRPAGRARTSASSSPTRRSTPTSTTSRTAATTASPGSSTTSRRSRTRPCGRSSGWRGRTAGSWSGGRDGAIPSYPLREGDVLTRVGDAAIDNEGMVDFDDGLRPPVHGADPAAGQGRDGPRPADPRRQAAGGRPAGDPRGRPADQAVPGPVSRPTSSTARWSSRRSIDEAASLLRAGEPVGDAGQSDPRRERRPRRLPGRGAGRGHRRRCWHIRSPRATRDPFGQVVTDVDGVKIKNLAAPRRGAPRRPGRVRDDPVPRRGVRDAGLPSQGDRGGDRRSSWPRTASRSGGRTT